MTTRTLITGANGFLGSALASYLTVGGGQEILLTDRNKNGLSEIAPTIICNFLEKEEVEKLICDFKPTRVFHMAGSFTNDFSRDLFSNVIVTRNLLEVISKVNFNCRVLLIGSASEYGDLNSISATSIIEDSDLRPSTIYGLTKKMQFDLMRYYCGICNIDVLMARTFNVFGKGMSNKLLIGNLYAQISEYKKKNINRIVLGDLTSTRDYISVEEACKNYDFLIKYGHTGEVYNVASGKSILVSELVQKIMSENLIPLNVLESNGYKSGSINPPCASIEKLKRLKEFYNYESNNH